MKLGKRQHQSREYSKEPDMAQPPKISSPHQHDVCVPVEQTHPIALLSGLKQSNKLLTPHKKWSDKEAITTKRKANISDKEEFHRVPISAGADNYCGPVVIQDQVSIQHDQGLLGVVPRSRLSADLSTRDLNPRTSTILGRLRLHRWKGTFLPQTQSSFLVKAQVSRLG